MDIDLKRKIKSLASHWKDQLFGKDYEDDYREPHLTIHGPRLSGKTTLAKAFVETHPNAYYFSFANLDDRNALIAFYKTFLPVADVISWKDASDKFNNKFNGSNILLILDDLSDFYERSSSDYRENFNIDISQIALACISNDDKLHGRSYIPIKYLTLSDYCKLFTDYSKQDIVRLYALTGGLPPVIKDLDEKASFEENVMNLLKTDSSFSSLVPDMLSKDFRTPESYYPILNSIANGHYRISEIAKEVGFPNNKCDTYIKALIELEYVEARAMPQSKNKAYYIKNCYVTAWFIYIYLSRSMQFKDTKKLSSLIIKTIDEKLAVFVFHDACRRYITEETNYRHYQFNEDLTPDKLRKPVTFTLKSKQKVTVGYWVELGDESLICVYPENLDIKYTIDEAEVIENKIRRIHTIYGTHLILFSVNRFSDACVKKAAESKELFACVTVERLKR